MSLVFASRMRSINLTFSFPRISWSGTWIGKFYFPFLYFQEEKKSCSQFSGILFFFSKFCSFFSLSPIQHRAHTPFWRKLFERVFASLRFFPTRSASYEYAYLSQNFGFFPQKGCWQINIPPFDGENFIPRAEQTSNFERESCYEHFQQKICLERLLELKCPFTIHDP